MIELFEHVQELVKEAAEDDSKRGIVQRLKRRRRRYYLFGKRIKAQEAKNLEKAVKKEQARTPEEKKVQQLVGRKPTAGQLARWGAIGAGAGVGGHLIRSGLEGGEKWVPKSAIKPGREVLHPRRLAGAAAVGAIYGSALPVARRLWDIRTARERPEAF